MNIISPGHTYELENHEQGGPVQIIQFIEKEPTGFDKFRTVHNGTTNEEVLAMLINRLQFLGNKLPSRENALAVTKCQEALMWLEQRTKDRTTRGVENTPKP